MICDNCIHNAVCEREHFENHCGYKHTEADVIVPELEKIETQIIRNSRPQWEKLVIDVTTCQLLIKERIEKLKGEQE